MDGFAKRTEKKKKGIIQSALQLLTEKGSKDLKIEDIAKRANVSQVTIYNYFGSKKKLIQEVVKQYIIERQDDHEKFLSSGKPFPEIIKCTILEKKAHSNVITGEILTEIYEEDSEIRSFLEDFYQKKSIPLFLEFIRKGREEGYIREEISDEAILFYMNAMKTTFEQNIKTLAFNPNIEQLSEQLFDLFLFGLLKEGKELK